MLPCAVVLLVIVLVEQFLYSYVTIQIGGRFNGAGGTMALPIDHMSWFGKDHYRLQLSLRFAIFQRQIFIIQEDFGVIQIFFPVIRLIKLNVKYYLSVCHGKLPNRIQVTQYRQ